MKKQPYFRPPSRSVQNVYLIPTYVMPPPLPCKQPPSELSAAGAAAPERTLSPPVAHSRRTPPSLVGLRPKVPLLPPLPLEAHLTAYGESMAPTHFQIELQEKLKKIDAINIQISALKRRIAAHVGVLEWTRATFMPGTIVGDEESSPGDSNIVTMEARILDLEHRASDLRAALYTAPDSTP